MKQEIKHELINHIIPFWNNLADFENGGFFSYVSHDLIVNKGAFRSVNLHSRILWFYSNCYLTLKDEDIAVAEKCLDMAKHCYDFLVKHFIDKESGGVFWSVNVRGVPANPMKHIYCHAFFIYATASYYRASGDSTAVNNAMRMFDLIETTMADDIGYLEAFDRDWGVIDNDELSENGIKAEKTMNVVLHLIEAYTELYKANKNGDVLTRLTYLMQLMYHKVYDKARQRLNVFFDRDMKVLGDVHSYGHDIEAAWLLGRAIEAAGDVLPVDLIANIRSMNRALVDKINEVAFDDSGAMYYEKVGAAVNRRRVWWTLSEGVVGFLDAYKLYEEQKYLDRAQMLWGYIKARMIDQRPGGEWFNELDYDHAPDVKLAVVDEWKCPYHNGRMCIEVLARL
jgi:mannobiose 2-epimerase